MFKIPGLSAIWSCDAGWCIGTPTGEIIVTTKNKLIYPTGGSGSTVYYDNNVINCIL
jgi:hypothetical protein